MTKLYLSNVKPYREKEVKLSDGKSVVVGFRLYKEEELKEFNERVDASIAELSNITVTEIEQVQASKSLEILNLLSDKAKGSIIFFKKVHLVTINEETFEEIESIIEDTRKGDDKIYFEYIRENIFTTYEELMELIQAFNEIRSIDFKAEQLKNL